MTNIRHLVLTCAAFAALSGCQAYTPPPPAPYSFKGLINPKSTPRDTTTAYTSMTRGGAAYREGGYEQVLGFRKVENTDTLATTPLDAGELSEHPLESAVAAVNEDDSRQSYSVYELSRWERYCGKGQMDERDWMFVTAQGTNRLPLHMIGDCQARTFSEYDYRAAWKQACSNKASLSVTQTEIIRTTIRPKEACKG